MPWQSKEQLKKLRAQKAASAQQAAQLADVERAKAAAAPTTAQARQKSAAGMPPPAPRAPSGSLPASAGKSVISGCSGKPQAAIIRPKLQAAGERSVNRTAQESAVPSGMSFMPVRLALRTANISEADLPAADNGPFRSFACRLSLRNLLQFMQTLHAQSQLRHSTNVALNSRAAYIYLTSQQRKPCHRSSLICICVR